MPELPEVETVRKTLQTQLKYPIIDKVDVCYPSLVDNMDVDMFCKTLQQEQIIDYKRIGKYLIFECTNVYLVSHLRMEGKYYIQQAENTYDKKHTHAIFYLQDGRQLQYHDTRKFGRMYVYDKNKEISKQSAFKHIGYDVFDDNVTSDYLYKKLHHRKIVLKQALLDQSVMAGVGNIYADEICFALKMHPETKIWHLRKKDFEQLLQHTRNILSQAIAQGGTTIRSYTSSLGVDGRFQLSLQVHAKPNQPCPICNTMIKKKVVATRGTCFCPNCQRKK